MSAARSVAVLADVHGNLPAFEAVARDVEALGAERVIANGDMVNRGPQGVAVVERLRARDWISTLGNHDDLMRMWVERDPALPPTHYDATIWKGTAWCARRLADADLLRDLIGLPMTARIDDGEAGTVLVSHGSPRHYREGYTARMPESTISEIVEMHPADVLVGSHTHRPLERRWGGRMVLNTGAVGAPFNGDPRAQYLLLRREGGAWRPEFRRVPYDREAALDAYAREGYAEEGGLSALVFWIEAATARSFLVPFLMWSEERDAEPDEAAWEAFRERHADRFVAPDAAGARVLARLGLAG